MTEPAPEPIRGDLLQRAGSPLAAALAAVQAELPRLGKSETGKVSGKSPTTGEYYSYEYKYADLASISEAVLPLLGRNGLAFTAWPGIVDGKLVLEYHLLHESGERLTGLYPISGNTAQAMGSSITYARRYCLCAVTGVAPDKDDDAAGAMAQHETRREEARAAQNAVDSTAYTNAVSAVTAAWMAHVGPWQKTAGEKAYAAWSHGGALEDATTDQLIGFRRWIMDQPLKDAGAPPDVEDGGPAEPSTDQTYRGSKNPDAPMSGRQRGALFAMLSEIGLTNQVDQLQWINRQLGTEYESRSKITAGNADLLITALKAGDVPAGSERAE